MKQLINRIDQQFYRFKKLIKLIDKQTIMKNVVKSVFGALLLSLLVISLPVLIIVNMFIIAKLTFLLAIFLVVIVVLWPFLYYRFYYTLLKNYHPQVNEINTKLPYWIESSIVSLTLFVIGIIVLSVIF